MGILIHWNNWERSSACKSYCSKHGFADKNMHEILYQGMRKVFKDEGGNDGLLYNGQILRAAQIIRAATNWNKWGYTEQDMEQMLWGGNYRLGLNYNSSLTIDVSYEENIYGEATEGMWFYNGDTIEVQFDALLAIAKGSMGTPFPNNDEGVELVADLIMAEIMHELMHTQGFTHEPREGPADKSFGSVYYHSLPHLAKLAYLGASGRWDFFSQLTSFVGGDYPQLAGLHSFDVIFIAVVQEVTIAPATSWSTASSLGDGFRVRPKGGPPPVRVPGSSYPRPAALAAPNADDPWFVLLYVKGADGRLWQSAINDGSSIGWWPHEEGGVLGSAPSCVATGQLVIEEHEIYIRGTDGGIWVKSPVAGTLWVNTGWHELPGGGRTSDAPAALTYQGRADVFVRGMDDGLWENWRDEQGEWVGWVRHDDSGGVRLASAPSVIVKPDGHREVYVRGSDGAVYGKSEDGNVWSAWESLGGIIQDAPCALGLPSGATEVYVRGMDDKLWITSRAHHGSWSGFEPHFADGVLRSGPAVISPGKGKRNVFSIGPGGGAQYSIGANILPE